MSFVKRPTDDSPLLGLEHLGPVAVVGRKRLIELAAQPIEYVWQDIAVAGTIVLLAGVPALRAWPNLAWPTRTAYTVSFGAGAVLCLSAIWLLASGAAGRAVAYAAAGAGLVLGLNQGLGLWFGALLCYTPG